MALHISRVEIENFRNFKHLLIDPFPATAVIVGENNVGKSNLLYALRILLDPDLPESARNLRQESLYDGSGGVGKAATVRIEVELSGFGDDPRACAVLYDLYVNDDPPRARIEYRYEPRQAMFDSAGPGESPAAITIADYDWSVAGGPAQDPRPIRAEPRRYIGMRVLPALRDASDELSRRRSPLGDLLERLTPDPEILKRAAANVDDAMNNLLNDDAVGRLQTSIRDHTTDMVGPALDVRPTLGIATAAPEQMLRQIRLFTDVDRRRGLTETSVGTANVLYLALLLEAVRQRRASNEHVTTILGVEEPEAHLHVQVQRRLFGYLLRQEPSLLLTSHSPHIAAVSPLRSIVLLRATAAGSVATTTAHSGLSVPQQADLERYLDATRAELLFARLALLVEGDAERFVVPALANAAGFDLDEHGVSVISVQGTDFAPFRALLGTNGLNIPHLILTDGDRVVDPYPATSDGLLRGLRLANTEIVNHLIRLFPEHPRIQGHRSLDSTHDSDIREELVNDGVFVGDTTLEVDIARLLPQTFEETANDMLGLQASKAQQACLKKIIADKDHQIDRKEYVDRIDGIGKGRWGQRLAHHISYTDLKHLSETLKPSHRCGYILQALDRASQIVRGHGLFSSLGEPNIAEPRT